MKIVGNLFNTSKKECFLLIVLLWTYAIVFGASKSTESEDISKQIKRSQLRNGLIKSLRQRRQPGREKAADYLRRTGRPKRWQDGEHVSELMAIENGQFIVYTTANADSATSITSDIVRDDPYYGLTGEGLTVGVWDAGVAYPTHQELIGRVESKDDATTTSSHSTHVTGTIAAAGVDDQAVGMAPLVHVDNYNWTDNTVEMAGVAMIDPDEPDAIQISNHSYGISCGWTKSGGLWYWYGDPAYQESFYFGMYFNSAPEFDEVCYNAPYFLPFRAAGNDRDDGTPGEGETYRVSSGSDWVSETYNSDTGPFPDNWDNGGFDTLMPGACAKNVVTIGAVNDAVGAEGRDLSKAAISSFSGWGPTDDGRVKPDLVANGVGVYSCWTSSDTPYYSGSGTSYATPAAAGAAVQLLDLYGRLFPNETMLSSTLKGLMIHTADDLGNPGPDYKFGWGLINNQQSAIKLIQHQRNASANNLIVDSLTKYSNSSDEFTFEWDRSNPVKITLCWTDPPGTVLYLLDDTTRKLINDLDMVVTAPDQITKYHEFVLDPDTPDATATTGDNDRDNVKQILIESPSQTGIYTVRVDYDQLSSDHNNGTQVYSLIISGQQQPMLNDIDTDGEIGIGDLTALAGHWLTDTAACDIYPAEGDGSVDLSDFTFLSRQWSE